MKLIQRAFIAGFLAFLMGGVSLAIIPASTAADRKTSEEQNKEQGYVASVDGEKYHLSSCRMANKVKPENKVLYQSEAEAQAGGKTPCLICKP